jgi:hypothetical protein
MDGYVSKPINAIVLFAEIKRLLPDGTTGTDKSAQETPNE